MNIIYISFDNYYCCILRYLYIITIKNYKSRIFKIYLYLLILFQVSNKLTEDLLSKDDKEREKKGEEDEQEGGNQEEKGEPPEKVEQELENLQKEIDLSRIDSKLGFINLETIKEGEVLETLSPMSKGSRAQFYFEDNWVSVSWTLFSGFFCFAFFFLLFIYFI